MILLRVQKSDRHYPVNIRKTDLGKFWGYSKNHQFWHSKWWHLFLSAADLVWTDDHYDCLVVQQKLMLIDIPSRAGSHIPAGRTKIIDSQVAKLLPKLMGSVSSQKTYTSPSWPPTHHFLQGLWILIIPLNPGCLIWILNPCSGLSYNPPQLSEKTLVSGRVICLIPLFLVGEALES